MKRIPATLALVVAGVGVLPGTGWGIQDLSLRHPPGVPHIGTALCAQPAPGAGLVCGDQPVPAGTVEVVTNPVTTVVHGGPPVMPVSAAAVVPQPIDDAAYAARLRADLCAARTVFCEVDDSGRYLVR